MRRGEVYLHNSEVVLCPRCLGHDVRKGGLLHGRQRFECLATGCNRVFVFRTMRQLIDDFIRDAARAMAVKAAALEVSVPVIAKATGIPERTIYDNIKKAQDQG